MSDGVPKSRVTLTYDTRQPEGREKPRELPFRLLVLGDLGGDKSHLALDARQVRELNGRNLGEVMKGLKIRVQGIALDEGSRKIDVLLDSMSSFSPDSILRTITGQKAAGQVVDPALRDAWEKDATAEKLWPGDPELTQKWALREHVVAFQKSYQNSKTLRAALKVFASPPGDDAAKSERSKAIEEMKTQLAGKLKTTAAAPAQSATSTASATGETK
jgi:hypothetical protein